MGANYIDNRGTKPSQFPSNDVVQKWFHNENYLWATETEEEIVL